MKNIMNQHRNNTSITNEGYLTGKLLIAMPFMQETLFKKTVIYICGHDTEGAIGLIINKNIRNFLFKDLIAQLHLNIEVSESLNHPKVYYGGPVEITRGFVLHSPDYKIDSTVVLDKHICITSTLEILRALAKKQGPENSLVCLGYTGWTAGQLETEIQDNDWIIIDATDDLIFKTSLEEKWHHSMAAIGVDPATLSIEIGHA
ncbi:YqgE/AlgH family protein [Candidatus Finniella inopinata]|uniref:UPF0301 protein EQU50_01485 n=1 Tax=Candidatus Finniella inopinata TaxID=1696036 RepID=A0A4Q7DL88_9PROT|nr:YqgE/AlgH family protein [Candidatus Finniella inopinata]RZI46924.1 YqgE/AlgH family protein [Candidatus Finniella inopinata]